jgi:hypothetical protein
MIYANMRDRVPFFFEPNFDAEIKPTEAALRILSQTSGENGIERLRVEYPPVTYGEFLKGKVGGNFVDASQPRDRY